MIRCRDFRKMIMGEKCRILYAALIQMRIKSEILVLSTGSFPFIVIRAQLHALLFHESLEIITIASLKLVDQLEMSDRIGRYRCNSSKHLFTSCLST